jgi:hypothetical protein
MLPEKNELKPVKPCKIGAGIGEEPAGDRPIPGPVPKSALRKRLSPTDRLKKRPKKKMGRPKGAGEARVVWARLPKSLWDSIDLVASRRGCSYHKLLSDFMQIRDVQNGLRDVVNFIKQDCLLRDLSERKKVAGPE